MPPHDEVTISSVTGPAAFHVQVVENVVSEHAGSIASSVFADSSLARSDGPEQAKTPRSAMAEQARAANVLDMHASTFVTPTIVVGRPKALQRTYRCESPVFRERGGARDVD